MSWIEIVKDIASVIGCVISFITLISIIVKPIRNAVIKKVITITHTDQIQQQERKLAEEDEKINKLTIICEQNAKSIKELKLMIFANESDRSRGELFNCGNRCRRGIPLSLEEYRYIQEVYKKYSEKLHCNGIGKEEYEFISRYYESQKNNKR